MTEQHDTYQAIALQLTARSVEHCKDRSEAQAAILEHIAETERKIRASAIFSEGYAGPPVRLIVLPEYLFTSYPGRVTIPAFAQQCGFALDGPEYEALCGVAQRCGVFLSGNAYEQDAAFPDLYFQTCFIISDAGEIVLRYRRLISMYAPSPHDVWEAYLDAYGADSIFPVADTSIGRLGAIASEEILYPEIARMLGFQGVEVLAHNSSEVGSPMSTPKDIAKQARAFENMAYVVSANSAGIAGGGLPLQCADGGSRIVDYRGKIIAQAGYGETFTAAGTIDLSALRKTRQMPAMLNSLARQRPGLFADGYAANAENFQRPDGMMKDGAPVVPDRDYFKRAQEAVIKRLDQRGIDLGD